MDFRRPLGPRVADGRRPRTRPAGCRRRLSEVGARSGSEPSRRSRARPPTAAPAYLASGACSPGCPSATHHCCPLVAVQVFAVAQRIGRSRTPSGDLIAGILGRQTHESNRLTNVRHGGATPLAPTTLLRGHVGCVDRLWVGENAQADSAIACPDVPQGAAKQPDHTREVGWRGSVRVRDIGDT